MVEIAPVHAGTSYPARASVLRRRMAAALEAAAPLRIPGDEAPFLLTPHIDLRVDLSCYAAAYRVLLERASFPEVVFILGVGHRAESDCSILSSAWTTPLGRVESEAEVCAAVAARVPEAAARDRAAYPGEHSIEFAVVWLQAVRDLAFPGRRFTVVPVLCGGLWDSVRRGRPPGGRSVFARFGRALARAGRSMGSDAAWVASIDGCHVGSRFDHPFPGNARVQDVVRRWEAVLWEYCAPGREREFFRHLAGVGNGFYFDGVGALTLATQFCHRKARVLQQGLWYEKTDASFVTFSGGLLRPVGAG